MGMRGCRDAGMQGGHFPRLKLARATRKAVQGFCRAVFAARHASLQEPAPHLHRVQLLLQFGFTAAHREQWARLVFKASYRKAI